MSCHVCYVKCCYVMLFFSVMVCYAMSCQCYVMLCHVVLRCVMHGFERLLGRCFKYCPEPVKDEAGLFEAILLLYATLALCHLRYHRLHCSIKP